MKEKDFEQLIKSKMDDLEVDVPEQLWANIERQLPGKKVMFKPIYRYVAGIAALLAGAVLLIGLLRDKSGTEKGESRPVLSELTIPAPPKPEEAATTTAEQLFVTAEADPARTTSYRKEIRAIATATTKERTEAAVTLAHNDRPAENNTPPVVIKEKKAPLKREAQSRSRIASQYRSRETTNPDASAFSNAQNENRGLSVSLLASNISSNQNTTASYQLPSKSAAYILMTSASDLSKEELSYTHNMPLTIGLMAEKKFHPVLGIETGLSYSYLKSEYKNKSGNIKGNQYLHYVSIPVNLIYHITEWGKLQVYAGIGGQIDFNVYGKRTDRIVTGKAVNNQAITSDNTTSVKDQAQWSVNCKAGLSYPLVSLLHLYAEPAFAYHFSNHSNVENIWKEKPANFTLQVGVRANF